MRFLVIGLTATFLAYPAAVPASACGASAHSAIAATSDYFAAKKKVLAKKNVKKKKKAKVEYMRAVPVK
jgi:hypothetical protein